MIDGRNSAEAFADALARRPYGGYQGTSISIVIAYGEGLFSANAVEGVRRVIDMPGDGPNNAGPPVAQARDRAGAAGIVVNGLPIVIPSLPSFHDLDRYFAEGVV